MTDSESQKGDEPEVGRTLRAAHQAKREGSRVIIKPGELIEARYGRGVSPSLSARKILALLIAKAAGDAWKPGTHTITKKELRGSHNGNERIASILSELMSLQFTMPTISARGRDSVLTSALMAWNVEERSLDGMAIIEWEFTQPGREMLQNSDYYGRMNRGALMSFQSKYGLSIYELGCMLVGRRDKSTKLTVDQLRERLGVREGTLQNFAQLRRAVLEKAKAEVDQLAHFVFTWTEKRGGRGGRVVEVELNFALKDGLAINEAADEVDRPKVGRIARRDGSAEVVVEMIAPGNVVKLPPPSGFPSGSLSFCSDPRVLVIFRDFGGGWDKDIIAQAYRDHMGDTLSDLRGERLYKSWEGFCKSFVRKRGRPA